MHDIHRVSRLHIVQRKQIGLSVGRGDFVDFLSLASRGVGREPGRINVVAEQILQRERVGRGICNQVVATVQLGHADYATDIHLIAVREPMRCRGYNAGISLRDASNGLGRAVQNLQTVAVDPHGLVAKLQDVGVAGLKLKRDQSVLDRAILDLAQELSARTARHTTMRHDHHVDHLGQAFAVFLNTNAPLKARRNFTCCE